MTEETKQAARDVTTAILLGASVLLVFALMFGAIEWREIWRSPIMWLDVAAGVALWVLDGK